MGGQTPSPSADAPQGVQRLPPGQRAHERTDANTAMLLWTMLGMVVVGAIIHFVLSGYLGIMIAYFGAGTLKSWTTARPDWGTNVQPPPPNLDIVDSSERERITGEENAHINNYEWVDKKNGIVRIPIWRAMDLFAEKERPR